MPYTITVYVRTKGELAAVSPKAATNFEGHTFRNFRCQNRPDPDDARHRVTLYSVRLTAVTPTSEPSKGYLPPRTSASLIVRTAPIGC